MKRFVVLGLILVALLPGYTKVMARIGSGIAPDLEQPDRQADLITVDKRQRRMQLWRQGESLAEYRISLGGAGDEGHKQREGDQRTPEGRYLIDWRNPKSMAHLSLHISYPNEQDEARARAAGYAPGGNIMFTAWPMAGAGSDRCIICGTGPTVASPCATTRCARSGHWCPMARLSKSAARARAAVRRSSVA